MEFAAQVFIKHEIAVSGSTVALDNAFELIDLQLRREKISPAFTINPYTSDNSPWRNTSAFRHRG